MTKWGIIAKKQEMTKLWIENKYVPVTLLVVPEQEILQWKSEDKDGYVAVVVWADKKELNKEKWNKVSYAHITEFRDVEQSDDWKAWAEQLIDVTAVKVTSISKWKWFQWVMKRYNFGWWPATHGSKFHRAAWSTGNRKPRRTIKGQKMAWRMWNDRVTLRSVPVVDMWTNDGETIVALKWSVPGAYNSFVKLSVV